MSEITAPALGAKSVQAGPYILSAGLLLFIFAGFYKLYVPSPVDWTILAGAFTCLGIALCWRSLTGVLRPLTWLYLAILLWTAIRLFPGMPHHGVQKLANAAVLGGIAYLAGYAIANNGPALLFTERLLAWAAVPAVAFLILTFKPGFNAIGESYQLTGIFMAASAIAAASIGMVPLIALAVVGCLLTGNLTAMVFGIPAVIVAVLIKDRRRAPATLGIAAVGVVVVIGVLAVFHIVPATLNRAVSKATTAVEFVARPTPVVVQHSPQAAATMRLAPRPAAPRPVPAAIPKTSVDRPALFAQAAREFVEHPALGGGYGNVTYLDSQPFPHNFILELAAETGIVGALLGVAFLLLAFRSAWVSQNPFALGYLILTAGFVMVSADWGDRAFLLGIGFAAGANLQRRRRIKLSGRGVADSQQATDGPRHDPRIVG